MTASVAAAPSDPPPPPPPPRPATRRKVTSVPWRPRTWASFAQLDGLDVSEEDGDPAPSPAPRSPPAPSPSSPPPPTPPPSSPPPPLPPSTAAYIQYMEHDDDCVPDRFQFWKDRVRQAQCDDDL